MQEIFKFKVTFILRRLCETGQTLKPNGGSPYTGYEDLAHFIEGVSVRGTSDVFQRLSCRKVVLQLLEHEMGKPLHSPRTPTHHHKLQKQNVNSILSVHTHACGS